MSEKTYSATSIPLGVLPSPLPLLALTTLLHFPSIRYPLLFPLPALTPLPLPVSLLTPLTTELVVWSLISWELWPTPI
jgi:hypothetical protein